MRATLFALLVLAACSKKQAEDPGPSCNQVVDHMLEVMKAGLTGHGNVEMGNRKQMVDQCESRKLTKEQRSCMLAAKDLVGLASCSGPPPAAPAKPGSGG